MLCNDSAIARPRVLLDRDRLAIAMAADNALAAKLGTKTGFNAIWSDDFGLSAS